MTRPSVVALGGGHGTAVTLRAARRYAGELTAIVSVADDGGSSGRLRELLDVVALGDLRKCLVALAAPGSLLARSFEWRFEVGELAGHALGNLILAGLVDAAGDLVTGVDEAASLLEAAGRVLPATTERVVLKADAALGEVAGQVAISEAGLIERVSLVPGDVSPPDEALAALERADQILIGPGSLFTSVLAAVAVPGIAEAMARAKGRRIYICNLRPQIPETEGFDVGAHLAALSLHGVTVDVVVCDSTAGMALGQVDTDVVDRPLAGANGLVHDPARLAVVLEDLLT
jgi:uncharacterized cofD-like protein